MTDERRELIARFKCDCNKECQAINPIWTPNSIANFILADRRRVLEEVEEPLKHIRFIEQNSDPVTDKDKCLSAIDEALTRIAKLKGEL